MKLLVLLVAFSLLVFARGQPDIDQLEKELDNIFSDVQEVMPDAVIQRIPDPVLTTNEGERGVPTMEAVQASNPDVNFVAKALATSTLPPWAIGVVAVGSVATAVGIALVIVGLSLRSNAASEPGYESFNEDAKSSSGSRKIALIVSGTIVGVLGLIAIGVSLGIALGAPTASGLTRGQIVSVRQPVFGIFVQQKDPRGRPSAFLQFWTYVNVNGKLKATRVQDAGTRPPTRDATAGNGQRMPPLNIPINAEAYVAHDGSLVISSWTLDAPITRVAPTGPKTLMIYRVNIEGKGCGTSSAPEACQGVCSFDDINNMIFANSDSTARLYRLLSQNTFDLRGVKADWKSVTIPDGSALLDVPNAVWQVIQKPTADYHAFFLPPNYGRDMFGGSAVGLGQVNGPISWMKMCDFQVFAHEFLHNAGAQHAGAYDNSGNWIEYGDVSSMMSMALGGASGWRGMGANQMDLLGWLPQSARMDITRNGDYRLQNSLSSNQGVRAARIVNGNFQPLWVEWREEVNQDTGIASGQNFYKWLGVRNPANIIGSLLVKTTSQDGKSQLQGIIPQGQSLSFGSGVTIKHSSTQLGAFSLSGLPGGSGDTTSTTTTTTRSQDDTTSTTTTTSRTGTVPPRNIRCATGNVNKRAGPGTNFAATPTSKGTAFNVIGTSGTWSQVRECSNGKTWYISSSLIVPCSAPCANP